ncbi:unnamed protein product [Bursaphelenchus xylophilus]|uniref:(pine wood nematode) hypothetical protein n=1 Tax=Bursaphelenchus xylophilus TaxID=6326 RepID=A0A1I7SWN0_BURXY|nr:unnamed protein product [Bursaphelenchus xylophilus]CAG9099688.1 unnamed protein product [Bursaphelenchus xylophilus]
MRSNWMLWVIWMTLNTISAAVLPSAYKLQRIEDDPDVVIEKMMTLCAKTMSTDRLVDSLVARLCADLRF